MILRPLTDGKVSGTGSVECQSRKIGGISISADGTNSAAVKIYNGHDDSGDIIFDMSTKYPVFVVSPIMADVNVYFSITGTSAYAQLYEWID